MTFLVVRNLSKHFGGLVAVDKLDFDLEKGQILGLIGPNGAGKTTVFHLITGFLRPDSGVVKFKGMNITGLSPDQTCKEGICRTFQITRPFSNLTVLENVMIGAFCRAQETEHAKLGAMEVLNYTGLSDKSNILVKRLTIADRKSIELARALSTRPELLLLDEIVGGLNPTETENMIQLIRKINNDGITIIVVEHVMKVVMSLSNSIIVLHHGEKIAEGSPREIARNKEVIKAYLGDVHAVA